MNFLKIVHENDADIAAMLPGNPHAIGAPDLFVESSARSCVCLLYTSDAADE